MSERIKSPQKITILICALAAALATAIFLYYYIQNQQTDSIAYSSDAVAWDSSIGDDADAGVITIPGYEAVPLKAGTDTTKVELGNPESNECLFQFDMILADTGEIIYSSDMVKPGTAIMTQQLDRTFETGDYDLIIRVSTCSLDGKTTYNGTDIETTLHVYEE